VINCYLTVVWLRYHHIQGRNPLLTLGVLLMILGFTLISTGLLAELITRMGHRGRKEYSLKQRLSRNEMKESRDAEAS
jgi:hypothetical protein